MLRIARCASRIFKNAKYKKFVFQASFQHSGPNDDLYEQILNADSDFQEFSSSYFRLAESKNCYLIQPYIKWGPKKLQDITPEEQLEEAKALIQTLPSWTIQDTIAVPLESLEEKSLFRTGSLEKLRNTILSNGNINAVFINVGTLKKAQVTNLEKQFTVPVFDRYNIVIKILKMHASSKHAKLQVALAELQYLQRSAVNPLHFSKADREKIKLMFQNREAKIKNAIKELRMHRSLLRNRRQKNDYPIVAVVGYTNAGKTSLIKALTGEEKLTPRNQLFATLDVTMHAGVLPSGLDVLYVDTVGFISDIPTDLIECFVATLEDAVLADVILHVEDISSSVYEFKRKHVINTLQQLAKQTETHDIMKKIISVGNKCDLVDSSKEFGILKVSSTTDVGLDVLRLEVESQILAATNRRKMKIKVPIGGDEIRWLYKNATVVSEQAMDSESQYCVVGVVITNAKLQQFKHHFTPTN